MGKLEDIRKLGQPEIGRRYGDAKPRDPAKAAKIESLKKEIEALTERPASETRDHIKAVRKLTGLTQAEFAATHGFNRRSLERWERGASRPGKAALTKLDEIKKAKEGK